MKHTSCTAALAVFGVATVASGFYRYLSADGGEKGFCFGLVMGSIALGAAFALRGGRRLLGVLLGTLATVTVGGWFGYEALILKGVSVAEPRQLGLLALAVLVGGVIARFAWITRSGSEQHGRSLP